jgi:KUP system potassium uptake protein
VPEAKRLKIGTIGTDVYRATVRYGFMESPDVPLALMRRSDCSSLCFIGWRLLISRAVNPSSQAAIVVCPMWRSHLFGPAPERCACDRLLPDSQHAP